MFLRMIRYCKIVLAMYLRTSLSIAVYSVILSTETIFVSISLVDLTNQFNEPAIWEQTRTLATSLGC